MRKLYWKIFLTFWATIIISIIVTSYISAEFVRGYNEAKHDSSFMKTLVAATTLVLNRGGEQEFVAFANYITEQEGVQLKLIPVTEDILPHVQLSDNQDTLAKSQESVFTARGISRRGPFIMSAPFTVKNGEQYRLIAKLPPKPFGALRFNWKAFLLRSLIALVITGIVCYLLSVYLSNPIQALRKAAKKLGEGDLSTRVGALFENRKDEIADLAIEFDQMAERLQILLQSREQLLRDISHELRSPLARLYVALELAKDKTNNLAEVELNRIALEAERLNELIGYIFSFVRMDKEGMGKVRETFSLTQLIQDMVDDANFENQNIQRVQFNMTENIDIKSNKMLITRAVENCLRNALQYTPEDKTITVTLFKNEKHVKIDIQDEGPGVPADKLPHIFDPFYRVDTVRTPQSGGYGLGLAIAKKSIEALRGTISAENTPGKGLKMSIVLVL